MNIKANLKAAPIVFPDETYGECAILICSMVGELGNGLCQRCWDKGRSLKKPNKLTDSQWRMRKSDG